MIGGTMKGRLCGQRTAEANAVFQTIGGVVDVFLGPPFEAGALRFGQFAHDPRGGAEDEGSRWDFGSLGHERLGADDGLFANDGAIEDHRAHAHQHLVTDLASVDHGAVAHGDPVAKETGEIVGEMQDGVVLHVGMVANDDAVDVAAQDGAIPNAGVVTEGDVANDGGESGDEDVFAQAGMAAEKPIELGVEFAHAAKVAKGA